MIYCTRTPITILKRLNRNKRITYQNQNNKIIILLYYIIINK